MKKTAPNKYYYYIVLEFMRNSHTKMSGWCIRETKNDLSTSNGLRSEIKALSEEHDANVLVVNWKKLKR